MSMVDVHGFLHTLSSDQLSTLLELLQQEDLLRRETQTLLQRDRKNLALLESLGFDVRDLVCEALDLMNVDDSVYVELPRDELERMAVHCQNLVEDEIETMESLKACHPAYATILENMERFEG